MSEMKQTSVIRGESEESLEALRASSQKHWDERVEATYEVLELLKGDPLKVSTLWSGNSGVCEITLVVPKTYLVFTDSGFVPLCNGSTEIGWDSDTFLNKVRAISRPLQPNQPLHPDALTRAGERQR